MKETVIKKWLRGPDDERASYVKLTNYGLTIADCNRSATIELEGCGWPLDENDSFIPGEKGHELDVARQHEVLEQSIQLAESDIDALRVLGETVTHARNRAIAYREKLRAVVLPSLEK